MAARRPPVVPLRLDVRVPFEARLRQLYDEQPHNRKGEWLRTVLRLGLEALEGGAALPAPAPTRASQVSPATPTQPSYSAVPAPQPAASVSVASRTGDAGEQRSSKRTNKPSLKGFFGESQQAEA